ncbi:hypothetical protein QBC33DRAFT_544415 [Phialemonium atrogriseum]|uniref:NACHT domain-containing protein n=1 Tax=Phialemonium atrogriseum TaxID=1093897 RepID=A0AAJ0BYK4_9PEZI|nr:uncharacterized protein QBC33DRAFT_544415 [Phialemonium atrogriseum]KAK1765484.1 hypothetical protein QBC33DRAFT_544415 [Phialemonium atrogriseum]
MCRWTKERITMSDDDASTGMHAEPKSKWARTSATCWCWREAIKIHNDGNKDRPEKQIPVASREQQIPAGSREPSTSIAISSPQAVQEQVAELLKSYKNGKPAGKLSHLSRGLLRYCKVVDLFCEGEPVQVGVVWGFFRFLIQVAAQEADWVDTISESLESVLQFIQRGEIILDITRETPQPRLSEIRQRVARLFACTIYFLQKAKTHLEKSRLRRVKRAVFENLDEKFAKKLEKLKNEANELTVFMQQLIYEDFQIHRYQTSLWHKSLDSRLSEMMDFLDESFIRSLAVPGSRWRHPMELLEGSPAISGQGIDDPTPGTCQWVQKDAAYTDWLNNGHCILWLLGYPGTGKSVIMKYLATRAIESEKFAFFFSRIPDKQDRSPTTFLRSFLGAVSATDRELIKALTSAPPPSQLDWQRRQEKAWSIIHEALKIRGRFTVLIDGLDECRFIDDSDISDFMARITQLCAHPNVRVIVASQHQGRFHDHIHKSLQLQVNHDNVHNDIAIYTVDFINTNPILEKCRNEIMAELSRRQKITFLEAKMQWMSVKGARTSKRRQDRIKKFPEGLSEVFQKVVREANQQLDQESRQFRRQIFLLLYGARRPLTVYLVCTAVALDGETRTLDDGDRFDNPEHDIRDICQPFVSLSDSLVDFVHTSFKDFLTFHVEPCGSPDEELRMSYEDSDDYFVRKCLAFLLLDRYKSPSQIGSLLRQNVYPEFSVPVLLEPCDDDSDDFYDYAARNWFIHLTSILNPTTDVLDMANEFLNTFAFVHWAECIFKADDGFHLPFQVNAKLQQWWAELPPKSKDRLRIERYFEGQYTALSDQYNAEEKDKVLQWLCLYELASYYSLSSDFETAKPILETLVKGLTDLLGEENPLTLRAASKGAHLYFGEGRMRKARDVFQQIAEIQRRVLPHDNPDSYKSLQLAALASYYITEYEASEERQKIAYSGLAGVLGESSYDALCSSLYLGYAITGMAHDLQARERFDEIYKAYSDSRGRDNGLSMISLVARGQSERILGKLSKALESYTQAWEIRVPLWGLQAFTVIDTAIHLLVVYREIGTPDKAWEILDQLDRESVTTKYFPQYCQITHIRGLLLYDRGDVQEARKLLQKLVHDTPADKNNRWLLWVRLTLAVILREQKDEDAASMLFSKLVREVNPESKALSLDEPDPLRLLKIAEEGLKLVRQRRDGEARSLLKGQDCQWVREEDFWIPVGGPAADTGLMTGP